MLETLIKSYLPHIGSLFIVLGPMMALLMLKLGRKNDISYIDELDTSKIADRDISDIADHFTVYRSYILSPHTRRTPLEHCPAAVLQGARYDIYSHMVGFSGQALAGLVTTILGIAVFFDHGYFVLLFFGLSIVYTAALIKLVTKGVHWLAPLKDYINRPDTPRPVWGLIPPPLEAPVTRARIYLFVYSAMLMVIYAMGIAYTH